MAYTYKDKIFILKSFPIQDNDIVFDCYSKNHGRIKIIAKSIKKEGSSNSAKMQLFNILNVDLVKCKTFDILQKSTIESEYGEKIANEYYRFDIAQKILELIIEYITEYEFAEHDIFELSQKAFEYLKDANEVRANEILEIFKYEFLKICGYL